jgi:hypothetical protein
LRCIVAYSVAVVGEHPVADAFILSLVSFAELTTALPELQQWA